MRRLLVIDDHDDIRENIAEILTLAGYEVTTAGDGKKASRPPSGKNPNW
ncbi:hypothetical protein ACQ86N_25735 [Puia sp. P3]